MAAEALAQHSPRRAGKAGGVRFKRIALEPGHWDLACMHCEPIDTVRAAAWFDAHQGEPYDWQLIVGYMSWIVPGKDGRWTCSESVAAARGVPEPQAWRVDPCNGHILLPTYRSK